MTALIRQYLTGSGIEVLDVQFDGAPLSVGFFTNGEDVVGFERGLVMTTGRAVSTISEQGADGVGESFASKMTGSTANSPALQAISTEVVEDVVQFTIKFVAYGDSLRFRYVFASEEYPEFACSDYNDIFGFFLSGPNPEGGSYQNRNIALIPGTNLPVSINNLHPGYPPSPNNCIPLYEQYYIDNLSSIVQPVYDGLTHAFTAEAKILPCATYTMTLAIADVFDKIYDSGVFLEAKSLDGDVNIAASFDAENAVLPENAQADSISISFSNIPPNLLPLTLKLGGSAVNGQDYALTDTVFSISNANQIVKLLIQPLPDTIKEGFETVELNVSSSLGCLQRQYTLYLADPADSLSGNDNEVVFLNGGSQTLAASPTFANSLLLSFENNTPVPINLTNVPVYSDIYVNDFPVDFLHDVNAIASVCLNVEHGWLDDLNIYLYTPDNRVLELTSDNGANADNYTNTCFSPTAENPITQGFTFAPGSFAPFSGYWQPEGPWSDIAGTPINGKWRLLIMDDNAGFTGILKDWSIRFYGEQLGQFKYLWSTGETSNAIPVSTPGIYSVHVSNDLSEFTKVFEVKAGNSGIREATNAMFSLTPNPALGSVSLFVRDGDVQVQRVSVFDAYGNVLLEQQSPGHIPGFENLNPGLYFVRLESDRGVFTQSIINAKR